MNTYRRPVLFATSAVVGSAIILMAIGSLFDWSAADYGKIFPIVRGIAALVGFAIFAAGVWVCAGSLFKSAAIRTSYESLALALLGLAIAYQNIHALLGVAFILALLEIRVRLGIEAKPNTPDKAL